jgi:hypothetical protein
VLAAVTVAMVAPKNTILLDAAALNPVPFIVTDVPTGPLAGLNELITGGDDWPKTRITEKRAIRLNKDILFIKVRVKVLFISMV